MRSITFYYTNDKNLSFNTNQITAGEIQDLINWYLGAGRDYIYTVEYTIQSTGTKFSHYLDKNQILRVDVIETSKSQ